jgi:hypothetical protein
MRYFEIVKPSARHILAYPDAVAAPGRTARERRDTKYLTANQPALVSDSLNQVNRPSRQQHLSPRRSQ